MIRKVLDVLQFQNDYKELYLLNAQLVQVLFLCGSLMNGLADFFKTVLTIKSAFVY
jgi:hypothetical protein